MLSWSILAALFLLFFSLVSKNITFKTIDMLVSCATQQRHKYQAGHCVMCSCFLTVFASARCFSLLGCPTQVGSQPLRYSTLSGKRPRSNDERTGSGIPIFVQERVEERQQKRVSVDKYWLTNAWCLIFRNYHNIITWDIFLVVFFCTMEWKSMKQ